MTALSLAGKGRVVADKRATRRSMKIPFPPCLYAVYYWTSISCHHTMVGNVERNIVSQGVSNYGSQGKL
jgi:hypothetical protein